MAFFSKKDSARKILVFDIGTSSVGGFFVAVRAGSKPEVLATSRSSLRLVDSPELKNLSNSVRRALDDSIKLLSEKIKKDGSAFHLDHIFVILSSPWFLSETRSIRMNREKDFVVHQKLLDDLTREEADLFKKRSGEKFSADPDKLEIIECDIMKISLNGYTVKESLSKKAHELVMSLYISTSRKEFLDTIRDSFSRQVGEIRLTFRSEPLTLFGALKEMIDCDEGFVLVDVGGEMTELALVKHYVIESVTAFNKGGNFMVRRIASSLGIGLDEALSLLKSRTSGHLEEAMQGKIGRILEGAGKDWQASLTKALAEIGKANTLPQNMILTGGASGIEVLKRAGESADLSRFAILGKPFNVIIFMPEHFDELINSAIIDRNDPQLTLPLLLVLEISKHA